ncbi:hypothetical protein L915_17149 [Phytophthora nicotianae]|uniref:Uncharacterized protein n=2 Tax=Phytophthora nicotianae TaxID=4792 RepID=V9EDA9_PHYNI|nr:hypothetical protein F443_17612 [Phytophthora nicotianae P1569]ETK76454.1 hypothetical protein L915_17149 [Phytophthora nicotianae]
MGSWSACVNNASNCAARERYASGFDVRSCRQRMRSDDDLRCTSSRNNQLALLLLLALGLQCRVAHHPVVVTMDSACIGVGG